VYILIALYSTRAALKSYKHETKKGLLVTSHPLIPRLHSCESPEAILTVCQGVVLLVCIGICCRGELLLQHILSGIPTGKCNLCGWSGMRGGMRRHARNGAEQPRGSAPATTTSHTFAPSLFPLLQDHRLFPRHKTTGRKSKTFLTTTHSTPSPTLSRHLDNDDQL
jgi:hypothetical protein